MTNAQAFLEVQRAYGTFDRYLWRFVEGRPLQGGVGPVRATSPESDALSKDLKKRGFRFVGSTICYAFMQATGMINDHRAPCFKAKRRR